MLFPLNLDASPSEEISIAENLDVFEDNGFKILVDESAPPGQRVKLVAVPFSKTVQFGKDDVHELASMLDQGNEGVHISKLLLKNDAIGDGNGSTTRKFIGKSRTVRLPQLVSMFASRACRSAVMVGTCLSQVEMTTIISRMGDIEQPWNCPHGRPTMRHLFDLLSSSSTAALDV